MAKRKRRAFTEEFKAETVRLIRESGKSIGVVARELGLTESAVRAWVRQAGIDAGQGPAGALPTEGRGGGGRLGRAPPAGGAGRGPFKKKTGPLPQGRR